jgi:hypothetical protein
MIIDFSLIPKKIEMIFLLTAEYSLKTNAEEINMATNATNTNTGDFNPFKTLLDQIAYGTLANDCGFGGDERSSITCILDRYCEMKREIERLKELGKETLQKNCDTITQLAEKHRDEMLKMLEENERLKELGKKMKYLKDNDWEKFCEVEKYYNEVSDDEEEEEEYTEEDIITAFIKEADKHGLSRVEREHGIANAKSLFATKLNPEQLKEKVNADIVRIVRENAELKGQVEHLKLGGYYCHTRPAPNAEINTDDAAFDHYWSVQDKDLTLWKVPRHLADVASAQTSYHGAVEQAFYDECFGEEYGKLKWMRVREMTQADLIKGGWQPKAEEEKYTDCDECGRFCYTGGEKYPDGFVCADCDEDEEDSEDDE